MWLHGNRRDFPLPENSQQRKKKVNWAKIFASYITNKELISLIHKMEKKKTNNFIKNEQEILIDHKNSSGL